MIKTSIKCLILLLLLPFSLQTLAHPENVLDEISNKSNAVCKPSPKIVCPLGEIQPIPTLKFLPFLGSPVHEDMTKASVSLSNIEGRIFNKDKDEGYIHGVFWNDDPEDLFCPQCSIFNPRLIDTITFARRFSKVKEDLEKECKNTNPSIIFKKNQLLERSHFGDLQFLHGMASTDGETAGVTQDKMLAWAEFTYKVAIGDISQQTKLNKVPVNNIPQLFIGDPEMESWTVEDLFRRKDFIKPIVIGSLLHMIQDTYFLGHSDRAQLDYYTVSTGQKVFARSPIIKEFHCYLNQNGDLHKRDDKWPNGLDANNPIGKQNPISVGVQILKYIQEKTPWTEVEKYLKGDVFQISNRDTPASAGKDYLKKCQSTFFTQPDLNCTNCQ
jgi:hypothetical protein